MLFSIRLPSYGIFHHLGNTWVSPSISHSTGKCSATSIELGELGKLVPIPSRKYRYFSSIKFPSYGILYNSGKAWLFVSISNNTGKFSKIHPVNSQVVSPQYYFFNLFQNLVIHSKNKQKKPIK